MNWKCLFSHDWKYMSDYSRECRRCPVNCAGWGSKHLNPGDDFSQIRIGTNNELDPDSLRRKETGTLGEIRGEK